MMTQINLCKTRSIVHKQRSNGFVDDCENHQVQEIPKTGILAVLVVAFLLHGCQEHDMGIGTSSDDIDPKVWSALSTKRIYFGHQSVGANIVQGIESLMREAPGNGLRLVDADPENAIIVGPVFQHSLIGTNGDPISKNTAFISSIRNRHRQRYDVAFFKYCFLDITKDSDLDRIFLDYKNSIDLLKMEFPGTSFVYVTTPLTVVQTGMIVQLKSLIGRPIGGYNDNRARERLNEMIRKEYNETGLVFDLAAIEARRQDGTEVMFNYLDGSYRALDSQYSSDGGHLNERGSRYVAKKLMEFIGGLEQR
jgi:hypothetical protein